MDFNLVDKEWIPVLYCDGRFERVGIRRALSEAGRIRQLAATNPMDNVALLRFLLGILYWCKGTPREADTKAQVEDGNHFPAGWFTKLDKHRDCFNLLGDGNRFFQNPRYAHYKPTHSINYLIQEVPTGNNWWHFRHATEGVDGLCPACCAMGLVRLPVFATSAGRGLTPSSGKSPGINSKPPLYILPVGESLADTLQLSWQPVQQPLGTPEWESPGMMLPQSGDVPILSGLTWLPRNVWLARREEPMSICASCGRCDRLIRRCVFDGKGSSKAENRNWRDPHVIYEMSKEGKTTSLQTSNALSSKNGAAAQWPKQLASIVQTHIPSGTRLLWIVGFSTVQNDKYLEATERVVALPHDSGWQQILIEFLEKWQKDVIGLSRRLQKRHELRNDTEVCLAADRILHGMDCSVTAGTTELFAADDSTRHRAARAHAPIVDAVAKFLSVGFTTRASQRRSEIAHTLAEISPGLLQDPHNHSVRKATANDTD